MSPPLFHSSGHDIQHSAEKELQKSYEKQEFHIFRAFDGEPELPVVGTMEYPKWAGDSSPSVPDPQIGLLGNFKETPQIQPHTIPLMNSKATELKETNKMILDHWIHEHNPCTCTSQLKEKWASPHWLSQLPSVKNLMSDDLKDVLTSCLLGDPTQRPTPKQLLRHPYFRSVFY